MHEKGHNIYSSFLHQKWNDEEIRGARAKTILLKVQASLELNEVKLSNINHFSECL